ncbi:protein kinase domain-containing protein [Ditylenchus destructor]|uniref:Protein kinase domain-containing protein n=1 Tax=Ditylenchus destructor TaxID=166010 RepID=A0AAD4R3Q3_9BILA|nr:protein kinase domain-containing protein [Ditylenchus destructor]
MSFSAESTLDKLNRLKREAQKRSQNISNKDSTAEQSGSSHSSGALSDHNSKLSFLQSQMTTSTVQDESTSAVQHQSLPANRSLEPTHPSSIRRPRETHNPAKILGSIQEEHKPLAECRKEEAKSRATPFKRQRMKINDKSYTLLTLLGKGGSSRVYQALDENPNDPKCVAIKCVDMSSADEYLRKAFENEIKLLESLQGSPYVIRMYDYEQRNNKLYVVLEKGESDFATFMQYQVGEKRVTIDDTFIKYHWQQMLRCVKVIHDRNIVHSDLKPANFLFVGASLKLIDFGIAAKIMPDKTSVVKDLQIGTLNFMSPEAIRGSCTNADGSTQYRIPLKSDVWSLGCILYAMVYGYTPLTCHTISSDQIQQIIARRDAEMSRKGR